MDCVFRIGMWKREVETDHSSYEKLWLKSFPVRSSVFRTSFKWRDAYSCAILCHHLEEKKCMVVNSYDNDLVLDKTTNVKAMLGDGWWTQYRGSLDREWLDDNGHSTSSMYSVAGCRIGLWHCCRWIKLSQLLSVWWHSCSSQAWASQQLAWP